MWENFVVAERIKRMGAPASFTAAYPDASFECVTPAELMRFLM